MGSDDVVQILKAINDLREEVRENRRELIKYKEENNKRWEENNKRWEENNKRWEENNKRWEENRREMAKMKEEIKEIKIEIRKEVKIQVENVMKEERKCIEDILWSFQTSVEKMYNENKLKIEQLQKVVGIS